MSGRVLTGSWWGRLTCRWPVQRGALVVVAVAVACAGLFCSAGAARAEGAAGTPALSWGRAQALRGIPAIHGVNPNVLFTSVACWSVNNCAAGGSFSGSEAATFPFVVTERNGRWSRAEVMPGPAALGTRGRVTAVSCAAGGYCVAGGYFTGRYNRTHSFVATFKNGRWQKALQVPGTKAAVGNASTNAVSCPFARQCEAAGQDASGAFVARQVKGIWQVAQRLPGLAAVRSLSCWSAVNCVATAGAPRQFYSLSVSEVHGVWGTGTQPPDGGWVTSVSCARDGYCAVGGWNQAGAYVASLRNGTWGATMTWPGSYPVEYLSCQSAGNCTAAGSTFVVNEADGVWGTPQNLFGPGITAVAVMSLSCGSAGNCAVGGGYALNNGRGEPFVASEVNGSWTGLTPVPGVMVLVRHRSPNNRAYALSCPSAGHCTAVGTYSDIDKRQLGFVTGPA